MEPTTAPLSGRRAQAAHNDQAILEAARAVVVADPSAPISAVANQAGVGMSALYRRYPSKEELLRRLSGDGLCRYLTEGRRPWPTTATPWPPSPGLWAASWTPTPTPSLASSCGSVENLKLLACQGFRSCSCHTLATVLRLTPQLGRQQPCPADGDQHREAAAGEQQRVDERVLAQVMGQGVHPGQLLWQ
jgi:AcrR family transcriptional regulator